MLKSLKNLFFPTVCLGCQKMLLLEENYICVFCRHELPMTNHLEKTENDVYDKFYGRVHFEHSSSMFYFHKKGIVQQMLHNLKYRGHQELGTLLGDWYGEDLKSIHEKINFDIIVAVPLHPKRFKSRGYNQLTTFGESLSKILEIPLKEDILFRKIHLASQAKKNLLVRNDLKDSVFDVDFTVNEHGKHILLIDDVITSGATIEACCSALLKIPNVKLSLVTMAFAHS